MSIYNFKKFFRGLYPGSVKNEKGKEMEAVGEF
jgi:hypothetical protein